MRASVLVLMLGACATESTVTLEGTAPPAADFAGGEAEDGTPTSPGTDGTCYYDADADGYGSTATGVDCSSVEDDSDWVKVPGDCNDSNANVNPAKAEVASNSIDDDCDGSIDESASTTTYYRDNDGDGYGSSVYGTTTTATAGYVSTNTDCDDTDTSVYPGATETADGEDDDCDGSIDEGTSSSTSCSSTESLVSGSFTAPAESTITSIEGEAQGTGSNTFSWVTWSTGTPSGMTVTYSRGSGSSTNNVVSFSYSLCTADASNWNASVEYVNSSGQTAWDCQGGSFTGTWVVMRDSTVDSATVSNWGSGCDNAWLTSWDVEDCEFDEDLDGICDEDEVY